MTDRVHLFANGSQFGDWMYNNCEQCPLWPNDAEWPDCELNEAIMRASISDGTVSAEEAQALGYPDDVRVYVWRCKKMEGLKDETP